MSSSPDSSSSSGGAPGRSADTPPAGARAGAAPAARRKVHRSPLAVVAWYMWLIFAVLNLADIAWQGGGHASLVIAAVIVLVTGVAYVAALRPRVIADDAAVTVRNPLRDIHVPWGAVTGIELGDSLRLNCTPDRVVHCWAVHASRRSRIRAQYRAQSRKAQGAQRVPGYGRMPAEARSRLAKTTGEIIAIQLSAQLEEARRRGAVRPDQAAGAQPGTAGGPFATWNWPAVAALAVPPVLVVLAVLIR